MALWQGRSPGLHAHTDRRAGASCLLETHPLSLSEPLGSLQVREWAEKKEGSIVRGSDQLWLLWMRDTVIQKCS